MTILIKSATEIAAKFIAVTPGRVQQYTEGVQDSAVDWEGPTLAAESNYEAGVTAAIGRKSFGKGVSRSGTSKWRAGAVGKGAQRWGPGVSASGTAYAEGFSPFRDVIANLNLPPRGPVGSPGNLERVAVVANALHARKIA